jgi:hypothetical protein
VALVKASRARGLSRNAVHRRGRLLALLLLFVAIAGPARAQGDLQASEPQVKAAFLFKFGSYIEWPADTFPRQDTPLTIGVLAADALAAELARFADGRSIDGRPVVVRTIRAGDPLADLNVVFVGRDGSDRLHEILASLRRGRTLAVTEFEGALASGSTINFVVVDGKVRFDVSVPASDAGSLRISSRLLAVARKVTGPS